VARNAGSHSEERLMYTMNNDDVISVQDAPGLTGKLSFFETGVNIETPKRNPSLFS